MSGIQRRRCRSSVAVLLAVLLCAALLQTGCGDQGREFAETGGSGDDVEKSSEEGRDLTADELKVFTEYVNRKENNGFLLSQYTEPGAVDLDEVLYNGAGMEMQPLSEDEKKKYEALGYPITTDVLRLTTGQIDEFLRRKMGISVEDVSKGLNWVYLEETDCYVTQHGDTNFCLFNCTEGRQTGEQEYDILCRADDPYVKDCELRLRKKGEEYLFVSNSFTDSAVGQTASRVIEDQSFMLDINDWGLVRFVSSGPDLLKNPKGDVTFELWKNNEPVYAFPHVAKDNIRTVDTFCQIEAVSFRDYDKDGYTDVIIICTYQRDMGESVGARYQEARVYKGAEKSFRYMDEMSLSLNIAKQNKTIAQIMEQIEEEETDSAKAKLDVYRQLKIFAEAKDEWSHTGYKWNDTDYNLFDMRFAMYDLDGDGSLELITCVTTGSGQYSENHFYRINSFCDGIEEIPQDYYDGDAELDIGMGIEVYLDTESGVTYFLATDVVKSSYAESWRTDGAFYLEGGWVRSRVYRTVRSLSLRQDDVAQGSFYDPAGNEISEAEWEELGRIFLENKTELSCSVGWQISSLEELRQASVEEVLELLAESCGAAGL